MKPLVTEKAAMMIERDNVLTFSLSKLETKETIKKELEEVLNVRIGKVRTLLRNNKKYAYVKLKKEFIAMDFATKLGLM